MSRTVNTSLTINFQSILEDGASAEGFLQAEVNADDNNGKSSFAYGDEVKYRVFKSTNVSSITAVSSDGQESPVSTGKTLMIEDEIITFIPPYPDPEATEVAAYTVSTQYPINGSVTATLLGGNGVGTVSQLGTELTCSAVPTSPTDIKVGVYKVSYQTKYDIRKLANVSLPSGMVGIDASYPVIIVLVGTLSS